MISERALRAILAVIAAYHVVTGLLALIAPDTFFDQIGHYGIENSHYVGDVGAFVLAFGVAVGIAVVRPPGGRRSSGWGRSGTGSTRSTMPSTPARRRARRAAGATRC